MEEVVIYIILGVALGVIIGWFIANLKSSAKVNSLKEERQKEFVNLDKEFAEFRATTNGQLKQLKIELDEKTSFLVEAKNELQNKIDALSAIEKEQATLLANYNAAKNTITEKEGLQEELQNKFTDKTTLQEETAKELATKIANFNAAKNDIVKQTETIDKLKNELDGLKVKFNSSNEDLATAKATNISLEEKLEREKKEIKELRDQFNIEFQNIASKILKENTTAFSDLNEAKIKELLNPLNKDIKEFKTKVEDVYNKESQERFSLGEKVKELAAKSEQISKDAINLTNALKGEAKTQGNWGEMILENILEKSGLRKDEEYFMEHQLLDENGKPLRSDSENKKMRPDAVIKYPDNRNVIIDSKVSLNAFKRYLAATELDEQNK
jgi:DNA recombination protein RmuC